MSEDFRQKYLKEQDDLNEKRAARLSKIDFYSFDDEEVSVIDVPYRKSNAKTKDNVTPHKAQPTQKRNNMSSEQAGRIGALNNNRLSSQTVNYGARRANNSTPSTPVNNRRVTNSQVQNNNAMQQRRTNVHSNQPNVNRQRNGSANNAKFKQNLSENESKAMMFALTGKAETPSNGGRVTLGSAERTVPNSTVRSGRNTSLRYKKKQNNTATYIKRSIIVFFTVIAFLLVSVYATVFCIAHGPSETVRDQLVLMAKQASATKWVPSLFLSSQTVDEILNKSEEVVQDVVSVDDYNKEDKNETENKWDNAIDGMLCETVSGSTYKAYVLLIKDPSRVFVGTSTDNFDNARAGVNIFEAAQRYDALACMNGGEFLDNGGHGSGYAPLGLTYSKGECVFDDGSNKTFFGFTSDNKLIVTESMTRAKADELNIRDAVSFQNGNTLIQRDGDNMIINYEDGNTGTAQRSAIGQSDDGTVIMIVTDGRTASCLGATHNDMIDLMISYGAVSAGMLDGGSSSMMYYKDYYEKYDVDTTNLDQYQKQGLLNNYKAFTAPRKIPTFFMVTR